ncbi:MAG: flagellar filament capping protein FliD [Rhodothermales bacterium]
MLSSISSSFLANDPYELLISQMIRIESQPKFALEDRKKEQSTFKDVLGDFDSTLSTLHSLLDTFTDQFSNPFEGRAVSSGESDAFNISATDKAAYGTHSLTVQRLASTDTRISKQFTSSGNELVNFFSTNGSQTFSVEVASPTDADPNNRVSISVTVNPTGTTDEDIIKEISIAIDDAMDAAVTAGTIKNTEKASASVINETSTTARLSLRSGETGYAKRVDFTDSANGLLALMEVNSAVIATGTSGGQVTKVGTGETDSDLNSKFLLDGLTIYRSSNQVTDALEGVTLSLKQTTTTASDFIVEPDSEGIKTQVESFISAYNDILTFIEAKSQVDGDTGFRGPFAGDSTLTGLRFDMRNDIATEVTGQPADAPSYLTDLGITIGDDGTLTLSDADALIAEVEDDPGAVQSLFSSTDGIATRLTNRLDRFLGIDGIIDNRQDVIDDRINRLDDQIARWDDLMEIRENQLRQQFARLQEAVAIFQGQQQTINSFFFGGGGFGVF